MQVRELMAEPAVVCRFHDTLSSVVTVMRDRDIGAVPVVDEDDRLIGIVTDRDICITSCDLGKSLDQIVVETAMTSPALYCGPDDPIEVAESTMQAHRVRRLPVVDQSRQVVGVLSLDDLAVEALRELDSGTSPLLIEPEEIARTLGAVCTPSHHAGRAAPPPGSKEAPRPGM